MPALPITFNRHLKQRLWGGRKLLTHYNIALPDASLYGESWEISDRHGDDEQSTVTSAGDFHGKTLNQLWNEHRAQVFGESYLEHPSKRLPLLIKILDAQQDLSIQVHPPKEVAKELNGEPKTEMWYIAHAEPGAKLYVGFKEHITPEDFQKAILEGSVSEHVHALTPKVGESILLESGRLHAIGAGLVIHEIQQNSDTTYRVFDWNRIDTDGKTRELHIKQAIKSIDFSDISPAMDTPKGDVICSCDYFEVAKQTIEQGQTITPNDSDKFAIYTVVQGSLKLGSSIYPMGQTILMPPNSLSLTAMDNSVVLITTI